MDLWPSGIPQATMRVDRRLNGRFWLDGQPDWERDVMYCQERTEPAWMDRLLGDYVPRRWPKGGARAKGGSEY